jgi:acyl-CoA thioester hydrolase
MVASFVHPVNVRFLEVDQQGVVFNMWYLAYFDDAMTAFLRANGLPYGEMMAAGYDVQLVHAEIDWKGGLRWEDDAGIGVRLLKLGTSSFRLEYEVLRAGESVARAEVVYVCIATDGSGKRPIPELLRRGLGAN